MFTIPHTDPELAQLCLTLNGLHLAASAVRSINPPDDPNPSLNLALLAINGRVQELTFLAQCRAVLVAARGGADLAANVIVQIMPDQIVMQPADPGQSSPPFPLDQATTETGEPARTV